MVMSLAAPSNSFDTHSPRPPLSRSTTVSPLLTANSTLGIKAQPDNREQVQATSILSRISSKSPLPHPPPANNTPACYPHEMGHYFDHKIHSEPCSRSSHVGKCSPEARPESTRRSSAYFSFPDFESTSQGIRECLSRAERRDVDGKGART